MASIVLSVHTSTRNEDVSFRTFLEPDYNNNERLLALNFEKKKKKKKKYLIHGRVLMQPVTLPRSRMMQSHGVKVMIVSGSNR